MKELKAKWFLLNKQGKHFNVTVFCNYGWIKKGKMLHYKVQTQQLLMGNWQYLDTWYNKLFNEHENPPYLIALLLKEKQQAKSRRKSF